MRSKTQKRAPLALRELVGCLGSSTEAAKKLGVSTGTVSTGVNAPTVTALLEIAARGLLNEMKKEEVATPHKIWFVRVKPKDEEVLKGLLTSLKIPYTQFNDDTNV